MLYSIRNWSEHYEKSQTKKVKHASWVPLPVKHDGKGFRRLMAMKNGAAIYGAWVLIVQVAAKCPTRGVLADGDGPLTAADLALKTGCPESVFSAALEVLSSPEVAWMLVARSQHAPSTLLEPATNSSLHNNTGQDNTGQDTTRESPNGDSCPEPDKPASEPALLEFPCVGNGARTWKLTAAKVAQYRESFPGVDVDAELRKARQWLLDNATKRKTAGGMAAYLGRWLGRCQDRAGPVVNGSAAHSRRAQALDFELDPR